METTYYSAENTSSFTMTKVFGWMFYAILLTAVTAFGLPYLLVAIGQTQLYAGLVIAGLIAVFILSFVGQFVIARARSKPVAIIVFSLFSVAMGIWISPLVIIYEAEVLIYSLFVTSAIFGIMAIYGAVTKRDLSGFGSFLFMMLLGSLVLLLLNLLIQSSSLNWILSYVVLAVYIGFIAFDINRVKKMASTGEFGLNAALLMALNLYIDFVYVFIRIVALIGNSKN